MIFGSAYLSRVIFECILCAHVHVLRKQRWSAKLNWFSVLLSAFHYTCFALTLIQMYKKVTGLMLDPATGMERSICLGYFSIYCFSFSNSSKRLPCVTKAFSILGLYLVNSWRKATLSCLFATARLRTSVQNENNLNVIYPKYWVLSSEMISFT